MDSYARIDISNSIIRIKYILLEDTFRWHSHHTKPTDINDMSCCRSWSCTNQLSAISSHSCCFPSFWLWSIVHVNIHSFLSCSINMRCVLIGEIPHTFHKSHWLFLMPGGKKYFYKVLLSLNTTVVTQLYWLVVIVTFTCCPWKDQHCGFSTFVFVVQSPTSVLGIHGFCSTLTCSQVWWDYFLSLFLCHVCQE